MNFYEFAERNPFLTFFLFSVVAVALVECVSAMFKDLNKPKK